MAMYFRKNYRAVRVCTPVYTFGFSDTYMGMTCYKYTAWCIPANTINKNRQDNVNLNELYDLGLDPYELTNRCVCLDPDPDLDLDMPYPVAVPGWLI